MKLSDLPRVAGRPWDLARRVTAEIVVPAFVDDRMRPHPPTEMLSRALALPTEIARYLQQSRDTDRGATTVQPTFDARPSGDPAAGRTAGAAPTAGSATPTAGTERAAAATNDAPAESPDDTAAAPLVEHEGFVLVADASTLVDGQPQIAEVGDTEVALFRVGNQYYATSNICPHAAGPIGEGDLDGKLVTCPFHGWIFDVTDGRCVNMDGECLSTYAVKQVDGKLLVKIDD